MKKHALIAIMAILLCGMFLFTACSNAGTVEVKPDANTTTPSTTDTTDTTATKLSGKITMSGSTSMQDLVTALGEEFTKKNPDVQIDVQGGGSGVGATNIAGKITDIGNLSRALKNEEKQPTFNEHIIAYDGIAVVVNSANKASALTSQQVADIYTGKITNWKDVGGADAAIVLVGREAGSGTRDGFEELLKVKDLCKYAVELSETGAVKSKVSSEPNAIGYMSLGSADTTVKVLPIDGITPSSATVLDKTYKLQRPFLSITNGEESPLLKAFFDYVMSAEGQAIVEKDGFVKVK